MVKTQGADDMRRITWIPSACCILLSFTTCKADDSTPTPPGAKLDFYSQAALEAEAEGDLTGRQLMLASASACGEESTALMGAFGLTRSAQGKWVSIDEHISNLRDKSESLVAYENVRESLPDSLEAHLHLARVALRGGLIPQSRAHFERVLDFDSDNISARQALGYRLFQGEWISPSHIANMVEQGKQAQASFDRFGKELIGIRNALGSSDPDRSAEASESLTQISDPNAILAAVSIFSNSSERVNSFFVRWLGRFTDERATQALARYACAHPVQEIRSLATNQLRERPFHDFVPFVLESVSAPINMMTIPVFAGGVLAGYRQAFSREAGDKTDVFVIDTAIQRRATPLLLNVPTEEEAEGSWITIGPENMPENGRVERNIRSVASIETRQCQAMTARQNLQISERNARAAELLSSISGRELSDDPKQLWKWWDDYNETEYQLDKPMRNRRITRRHEIPLFVGVAYSEDGGASEAVSPPPQANFARPGFGFGGGRLGGECFAAGTPVLTAHGLRRIEKLRVGDIVFCKNIDTGEVVLRPILRTTERPPRATLSLKVGQSQLRCTTGHLYWVSGTGWVKASKLRSGDVLNTAGTPVIVDSIQPEIAIKTYNLEVADFNNYFVGDDRLLSHDVTPRRAARVSVPGFVSIAN